LVPVKDVTASLPFVPEYNHCSLPGFVLLITILFLRNIRQVSVSLAKTMITATTMAVLLKPMITAHRLLLFQTQKHTSIIAKQQKQHGSLLVASSVRQSDNYCQNLVDEFDPNIPIEKALTPPSSWYTDPSFFDFELHRVFYKGWQAVG